MRIVVSGTLPNDIIAPTIVLIPSTWDDYTYRTQFEVNVTKPDGTFATIGSVKILACDYSVGPNDLKETEALLGGVAEGALPPDRFCSLGQSSTYYRRLAELPNEQGLSVLSSLNDICFSTTDPWWKSSRGFDASLLRTNAANLAQRDARFVFAGLTPDGSQHHTIRFSRNNGFTLGGPTSIEFYFDGTLRVPGRLNVVVGRNGAGKTSLIAGMADWFAQTRQSNWETYIPEFSRVVIASFNPHDTQIRVRSESAVNVRYIGSRPAGHQLVDLLSRLETLNEAAPEIWTKELLGVFPSALMMKKQMPRTSAGPEARQRLKTLRSDAQWPPFISRALEGACTPDQFTGDVEATFDKMSAGQKVITELYASLFQEVEPKSLVLIDEPENHLHPSLIARFVRHFNEFLDQRRAFAIVATHSPIVVQETPSRFVTILTRSDDETTANRPSFETFGESIENITAHLFDTDFRSSHWKYVLRNLANEHKSLEEIAKCVGDGELPLLARSYVAYFLARKGTPQ